MHAIRVGDVTYGKPNMAALEGDLGRRIMKAIHDTKKPDFSQLDARCAEVSARMNEAKAHGTF